MMKNILKIIFLYGCAVSMHSLAKDACDLYKVPGDCLGQPIGAIEELNFSPGSVLDSHYQELRSFANKNPLGLDITVYEKDGMICAIRYTQSTSRSSIGLRDFNRIKEKIVSRYVSSPWVEHSGSPDRSDRKSYNDGRTRINITRAHVFFADLSGCG